MKTPIASGRRLLLVSTACLAVAGSAEAANVLETRVTHDNGRYTVKFEVHIDAKQDTVRRDLTDYAHYTRLSETIRESRVIAVHSPDRARVAVTLDACVLVFCKTLHIVREVEARPNGDLVTVAVPEESDFRYAHERWRIIADGAGTRLVYEAELVPDFYVPPLIGPWLLKYRISDELKTIAQRLELLANQ